jgi:hypothetical protein
MATIAKQHGKKAPSKRAGGSRPRPIDDEALRSAAGGKATQPATKFSPTHVRFDPYKSFKFR